LGKGADFIVAIEVVGDVHAADFFNGRIEGDFKAVIGKKFKKPAVFFSESGSKMAHINDFGRLVVIVAVLGRSCR
jgi:hypothetical protein